MFRVFREKGAVPWTVAAGITALELGLTEMLGWVHWAVLRFFPAAPKRVRVGPRVTRWQMAPAVSEESTLLLLILLLPFGHLVELFLGLPKDIVEISIREIALQWKERARKGQLWLLQRLGHLRWLCPFLTVPLTPTVPVLLPVCMVGSGTSQQLFLIPLPKAPGE